MAITYTDNLTLPIVPADNTDWEAAYNAMIQKLDRNPGIRIVADEAAMVALNVFDGRVCWREDVEWFYYYNETETQWVEWPRPSEEAAQYMAMADTAQEETAQVAALGSQNGTIDFAYMPDMGAQIQLYMVQVQPFASLTSEGNEAVVLSAETETQLTEKNTASIDETGPQVHDIVVKSAASGGEVQTLDLDGAAPTAEVQSLTLGGADGGTFTLGDGVTNTDPIAFDAVAATIETALEGIYGAGNVAVAADEADFIITFAVSVGDSDLEGNFASLTNATTPGLTLDTAAPVVYVLNTDYTVDVDATGYTRIARIDGGAIGDGNTVYVDYDWRDGVTGFKFQLYSEASRTNLVYELDTSEDDTWNAGHAVRDPNYGLMPHAYYIDEDDNGQMYYTIHNLDAALGSKFMVDMKYKAVV